MICITKLIDKEFELTMEQKMTKDEFVSIRKALGLTQKEMAEWLGVSTIHIIRTEGKGANGYDVSGNLDKKVKALLKKMGVDIHEILVNEGGF
jgi:predicted transcriptional regulator